jgi:hypothetical protein
VAVIARWRWEWQAERAASERMTFVRPTEPAPRRNRFRAASRAVAGTKLAAGGAGRRRAPEIAPAGAKEPPARGVRRVTLQVRARKPGCRCAAATGKVLTSRAESRRHRARRRRAPAVRSRDRQRQYVRVRYRRPDVDLAPHIKIDVARLKLE